MYVRLYHKSADNQVAQIFPNRFRTDNFARGGEAIASAWPGDAFEFTMSAPFGTEIIQAIASPVAIRGDLAAPPATCGCVPISPSTPAETDFRHTTRRGAEEGLVVVPPSSPSPATRPPRCKRHHHSAPPAVQALAVDEW